MTKSKGNHLGSVATFSCNNVFILSGATAIAYNVESADTPCPASEILQIVPAQVCSNTNNA